MTDWLSASAMLLAGVIVGFMFLYGMKRRQQRTDSGRADLEAKRDALLARLREDPSDKRLELEAAEVLKKLDGMRGRGAQPPSAVQPAEAATPQHAALKGFLWGAGSVAVLAAIGWFVMQSAKPKETAGMSPAPAAANDTALADLQNAVQKTPDNLNLRDDLAKAYLDRDNLTGVAQQTQYVLQRNPNDARALTYQALVHIAARQPDAAMAMLQKATKNDPNLLDAWVGLAWLNAESGDMNKAQAAIDEGKRRHPEEAQRLDQLMAHLRAPQQTMPEQMAAANAPAPQAAAPSAASAPAASTAAASGQAVHITLNAANGSHPPTAVIWVIARPAGASSGPPSAVKRIPVGTFPITIDLSAADSMMGQPLPPKMHIEARIDSDGDPMTKDPKDPTASQDGVAVGSSVTLTLK